MTRHVSYLDLSPGDRDVLRRAYTFHRRQGVCAAFVRAVVSAVAVGVGLGVVSERVEWVRGDDVTYGVLTFRGAA